MSTAPEDYVPLVLAPGGPPLPIATARALPTDDLFGSVAAHVQELFDNTESQLGAGMHSTRYAFALQNGTAISADLLSVRPAHLQCLLADLADETSSYDGPLTGHVISAAAGLTIWTRAGNRVIDAAARAWHSIESAGALDAATTMTTPSLYGNKLRLTRFIAPVASVALPEAVPVLDLMAGTGVVSRALAELHPVTPNDPNPYAKLLAGAQGIVSSGRPASQIIFDLRDPFLDNHAALSALVRPMLDQEAAYFHGEADEHVAARYAAWATDQVLAPTDGSAAGPARLVTERYANVYFGIEQAVEIDSLRRAIDVSFGAQSIERDLCLAALLVACTICATGPHFAQPLRPTSVSALRTFIERRARSVAWEFDLALGRLIARRPTRHMIAPATGHNWREALAAFAVKHSGSPAAVYVDPPYSKLQYSRYYHVLNVLLAYDYPRVHGSGRYPPVQDRFSSKFEYQPGTARRELESLIRTTSELGLTMLLSYGDTGFVGMADIVEAMGTSFARTRIFHERLRHHSQGRPSSTGRPSVVEYILVGDP